MSEKYRNSSNNFDKKNPKLKNESKIQENQKNSENLQKNFSKIQNFGEYKEKKMGVLRLNQEQEKILTKDIKLTEVNSINIMKTNEFLDELFKNNDEGIRENFDINIGDKVVWNKENGKLVISTSEGKFVFSIRFSPETPEEKRKSEESARENIEKGGQSLGNWLVRRGPFPGKKNSCGASCGELLNQFGFRKLLPQTGRDGKNWDTIIEKYLPNYFTKVKVNHPKDAPAGSVVVFNGNAKLGSAKRKIHGHVEIKGSDGNFYSYYKTANPGGSSRTNEKNPQKYRQLTGFTGYAYVYNGKKPPR